MKVKELIAQLEKLDAEMSVYISIDEKGTQQSSVDKAVKEYDENVEYDTAVIFPSVGIEKVVLEKLLKE